MIYNLRRIIALAVAVTFLATPCFAEDKAFDFTKVVKGALYGGLTGSLVGAAIMVFTKKPLDHVEIVGYGAAAGALVGAAYGTVLAGRSLAEVEKGGVTFALPTIMPEIREANSRGQVAFVATAELIRGRF